MKPLLVTTRSRRAPDAPRPAADAAVGHGMEIALTLALFIGLGALLDRWLGTRPLLTIAFLVLAAIGSFVRMKYAYDASMERLEAERRGAGTSDAT